MLQWAQGSYDWAREDPRLVGLNPWHYSERQNSGYPHDKYPFGLGTVDFPQVLAALRDIKTGGGAAPWR